MCEVGWGEAHTHVTCDTVNKRFMQGVSRSCEHGVPRGVHRRWQSRSRWEWAVNAVGSLQILGAPHRFSCAHRSWKSPDHA